MSHPQFPTSMKFHIPPTRIVIDSSYLVIQITIGLFFVIY